MDSSAINILSQGANRKVRKLLGRAYLRENRVEDALEVYISILHDNPIDADVLIILGNLYWLGGSLVTAKGLYQRALEICPGHPLAEMRASQASAQMELTPQAEAASQASLGQIDWPDWDPKAALAAPALARLAERLRDAAEPVCQEAIRTAADIVADNVADRQAESGVPVQEYVQQQLMPALIDLNIRQARAAGHSELAEALQSLQFNLIRQADDRWGQAELAQAVPPEPASIEESTNK